MAHDCSAICLQSRQSDDKARTGDFASRCVAAYDRSRMTIGMFTDVYRPSVNGVTRSIDATREALEARGHTVYVIAPHARHVVDDPRVFRLPSVKRLSPPNIPIAVAFAPFVIETVRPLGVDIVHSHLPFTVGSIGHTIARELGLPTVHTYHTHLTEYAHYAPPLPGLRYSVRYGLRRLSRRFCNSADHVIAPSTAIRELLLEYGVVQPITVLPSGIQCHDFRRLSDGERQLVRREYGIPMQSCLVLFAGRLAREKNLPLLVNAYARLAATRPDAHLVIAGGGPLERQLGRRLRTLRLDARVTMTGTLSREAIAKVFGSADVFAFPSVTETQGIVIAEALAASCPVVAVDAMGAQDSVQDGVNGFLVPASERAFAARLEQVVADRKLRNRMAKEALASSAAFSIDTVTDQLVGLYRSLPSSG